jgi:hypothetical protein
MDAESSHSAYVLRMTSPRSLLCGAALGLLLAVPCGAATAQEASVEWDPWMVLLPIHHPEGSAQVAPAHSPEEELKRMKPGGPGPDIARAHKGKGGHEVHWLPLEPGSGPSSSPTHGVIKFAEHFPAGIAPQGLTDNAAAYLYRSIRTDEAARVPVTLGSDDGCRVWFNGELVLDVNKPRGVNPRDDALELDLLPGVNHFFVKVVNGGGAWGYQMRAEEGLSPGERQALQPAINAAIDRGVEYLMATQQRDGSWGYHADPYRNGQTALSIYALLKSGVKPEHQVIRRGLSFLSQRPPHRTYSLACQLLALSSTNNPSDDEWIAQLVEELSDWQRGDFAYPMGEPDLSCTQYGALGYWIAAKHDVRVSKRAWTDLARSVLKYQNKDGGFCYRPGNATTGSMTVAGLTVIAVCRQYFGEDGFPKQWRKALDTAQEEGLRWLAENFSATENPAADDASRNRWKYYYLYGVERLAALLEVDSFGRHDWYWEGAQFLIGAQGEQGNWATAYGESEPNTAFALLFLNRATATVSGPGASSNQGRLYATDGPDSKVVLRAKGDTPLNLWLSELRPELVASHSRAGERGEGVYLEAVEYFADGVSIARIPADPTKPWASQPYAYQHSFPERGQYEVQLKLHFADVPGAEGGRPEPVTSPPLKVTINERLEDWMLDYTDDHRLNLAPGERKTVSASSSRGGGNEAAKAFDGHQSTSWICKADDSDPSVTVEFNKAVRIDRIVLSHAAGSEIYKGQFDLATKVEVNLGGKRDALVFDVNPDVNLKTTLMLPRKSKVSRLQVRVLERISGTKFKGCVGFTEVELRLGDEE